MDKYTLKELHLIKDAATATLVYMTRNIDAYSEAIENERAIYDASKALQDLYELVEKEIKSRPQSLTSNED